ncbi:hypothetical protein D1631_12255 [Chryseobacterium nematophagum]|uniref:Uncharacterized protein n=1 Tax=Chryseobacterium nematophagum TaxID=2305228 RepID=A0A3M7TGD8_9FLAO|nr:hypothetical protein [Chryseobacterium nematophagum]RNA62653.1 hypothetical protein D1631_12255 [Chryseobacterium nematophagum]
MNNQNQEEEFDGIFRNRLITENNNFLRDCKKIISQFTNMDIYIDIIDNPEVNATAAKSKNSNTYFIALNRGTIELFDYYARKFCAHPDILFEFGNSRKENNSIKIYNSIIKNSNHIIEEDPPVKPITEDRQKLYKLVFSQLILNILLHELGHIVNGHIDFLQKSGIDYMEERQEKTKKLTIIQSLDSQTLEIDADAFSAIETLRVLMENFNTKDIFKTLLPDYKLVFKLWAFVRQVCWRIMENNYIGKDLLEISHPPTGIRHHYSRIACLDLIKGRGGVELIDLFNDSFALGTAQADEAFKIISETYTIPSPLSEKPSNEHMNHGGYIFCHWDSIRESLITFATYTLRDPNIYDDSSKSKEIKERYKQLILSSKSRS